MDPSRSSFSAGVSYNFLGYHMTSLGSFRIVVVGSFLLATCGFTQFLHAASDISLSAESPYTLKTGYNSQAIAPSFVQALASPEDSPSAWPSLINETASADNAYPDASFKYDNDSPSSDSMLAIFTGNLTTATQVALSVPASLNSLVPASANAGGPGFVLTVNGVGFNETSTLMWNGLPRSTSLQSDSQLTAFIFPADIAIPGQATVRVDNGSLKSNALTFLISTKPLLSLQPNSLGFVTSAGTSPPSKTLQILSAGTTEQGWSAAVTTQSGGNWLSVSPATGSTPAGLTVSVRSDNLAPGTYSGTISVNVIPATNPPTAPQILPVTLAVGIPSVPQGGLVNGASFASNVPVSPGSIVSLFGERLAIKAIAATSLPLPTNLEGTQVLVNDRPAPLYFVSPQQINFQFPLETLSQGTAATVVVVSSGVRSLPVIVPIIPESPGIFTASPGGTGQGAAVNEDFTLNSPENPASPGGVIQIFCTGLGQTNPPIQTGQPGSSEPPLNTTIATPIVFIGGIQAEVLFSGVAPGYVGLYQVNVRVPSAVVPASNVPIWIVRSGSATSNIATITVR